MFKRKNKKGVMGILLVFIIFFTILVIGFAAVMLTGALDFASDTVTPVMKEIGMVGDANITQAAESTFGVADTMVQSLPWLVAFGYVIMLIFTIVFVSVARINPHPAFIGLYFGLAILLVFGAIIISNMYQDIYEGDDEMGTRLQEQAAMSYLILYSPMIFAIIAFVAGIYMFANRGDNIGGSSI